MGRTSLSFHIHLCSTNEAVYATKKLIQETCNQCFPTDVVNIVHNIQKFI